MFCEIFSMSQIKWRLEQIMCSKLFVVRGGARIILLGGESREKKSTNLQGFEAASTE